MDNHDQNIAIATALGYTNIKKLHKFSCGVEICYGITGTFHEVTSTQPWIPDYTSDLNAMHEAEKLLSEEQFGTYINWLDVVCGGELAVSDMVEGASVAFCYVHAPASARAETFLRTLNLWTD